jgi:hypothetical protein
MEQLKILIPVVVCLVVSCKSPSEKVMDSFKEVNESLEKTNKTVDSLTQKMKFVGFDKAVADSLERLFNNASVYIKHLKNELDSTDSNGENPDVAEDILIKTQKGDSLYYYVMNIYDVGIKYSDSSLRKGYISLRSSDKDKWLDKYFRKVPTIAASTILSRFQNDLVQIKLAVMSADIKELKNKILAE